MDAPASGAATPQPMLSLPAPGAALSPQATGLPLLDALRLDRPLLESLPPDVRDLLLDYAAAWAPPEELLALAGLVRDLHGPLLFLLDYQAAALLRLGRSAEALDVIERRQRRSTTIASQALEAEALLALGRTAHARAVADDLAQSYPRHITAVSAAAAVYTAAGDFPAARALLEGYLDWRPGDATATAVLAQLAYRAGDSDLADQYVQRLKAQQPPAFQFEAGSLRSLQPAHRLEQVGHAARLAIVQVRRDSRA